MQFLVNQKGKIQKQQSFEINWSSIISRATLNLFTKDFLIPQTILMALFPQAFTLSAKATDVFCRFAVHFEAVEQDTLQLAFCYILQATQEFQLLCPDSAINSFATLVVRLRSNISRKSLDLQRPQKMPTQNRMHRNGIL